MGRENQSKFIEIYEKEADAVFRYASLRVSSREEARDIVADSFLRLWQVFNKEAFIKNTRALLFTIARNRVIDWYRKKKPVSLEIMLEGEDGEFFEIADPSVHKEIEANAEAKLVLKALNNLRAEYREVVYLRFVEDLSPPEIADIVGGTANAISIRINRGVEELRKVLRIESQTK